MKQKIVIKVQMACEKCKVKAMSVGAVAEGVNSLAIEGAGKDRLVVIGDGVDAAKLTCKLRKKLCCYATLLSVEEVKPPPSVTQKPPPETKKPDPAPKKPEPKTPDPAPKKQEPKTPDPAKKQEQKTPDPAKKQLEPKTPDPTSSSCSYSSQFVICHCHQYYPQYCPKYCEVVCDENPSYCSIL